MLVPPPVVRPHSATKSSESWHPVAPSVAMAATATMAGFFRNDRPREAAGGLWWLPWWS
jgi:hypothetical protein